MSRYMRELRVTINDMYGNFKNVPDYDLNVYNPNERALGIRLFGTNKFQGLGTRFNIMPFIRKLENYGWEVLDVQSRYQYKATVLDIDINQPFTYLEVRKIEQTDIEPIKHISVCSCQENGEHCCQIHSQEPDVGVLVINPKNFPVKIKKQAD